MKYKLVPVEPTRKMWAVAGDALVALNSRHHDAISSAVYEAMLAAAPNVEQKPTLVAWVLYDTTTDEKYIKMNPEDGSLAIFDNEEDAMTAKRLHCGTDYKRCEYYSAPQPAPDVTNLVGVLEEMIDVAKAVDSWESFPSAPIDRAQDALDAYRKQGGSK